MEVNNHFEEKKNNGMYFALNRGHDHRQISPFNSEYTLAHIDLYSSEYRKYTKQRLTRQSKQNANA